MTDPAALVPHEGVSLMPALVGSVEAIDSNLKEFSQFIARQMIPKVDYMTLAGGKSPTILKPGLEKLLTYHGFGCRFQRVDAECVRNTTKGEEEITMVYTATVYDKATGQVIVEGSEGECSTFEEKYRGRWLWPNKVPSALATSMETLPMKNTGKGPMYWVDHSGPQILEQGNTIRKMAQKRAMAGATLHACRASAFYTQDIEDMPAEALQYGGGAQQQQRPVEAVQTIKQKEEVKRLCVEQQLGGKDLDAFCVKTYRKHYQVNVNGVWEPQLTTKESGDLIAALKLKEVPAYAEPEVEKPAEEPTIAPPMEGEVLAPDDPAQKVIEGFDGADAGPALAAEAEARAEENKGDFGG